MDIVKDTPSLQALINAYRSAGKKIGFVPTMGALHDGHLSLVKLAKKKADIVVVSIFVNPTQFAEGEDFDSYPRHEEDDAALLRAEQVDVLFLPTRADLYPDGLNSDIMTGEAAQGLETDFRPTFFDGVVNVVNRLSRAVKPDIAIFGEKDFQQLMVIREMVERLNLPIEIIGAKIIRDAHGLALSSRNAYLSEAELEIARTLNKILQDNPTEEKLLNAGFDKVDYIEKRWNRVLAAAWVGKTRLIDNFSI